MHLPDNTLIFVHIPKTGGNWVQNQLIGYSDDRKVRTSDFQDLHNRFNVQGPMTIDKHQPLDQSRRLLGEAFDGYRFLAIFRDPVDRLLSLYFSPHNWLRADGKDGGYRVADEEAIDFSIERFDALVKQVPSSFQMLSYRPASDNGTMAALPRRLFLMRFDRLREDMARAAEILGLDLGDIGRAGAVNVSAAPTLKERLRSDAAVEAAVLASHHRLDREILAPLLDQSFGDVASLAR